MSTRVKRVLNISVLVLLVLGVLFFSCLSVREYLPYIGNYIKTEKMLGEVAGRDERGRRKIDWEKLHKMNEDIIAWIEIAEGFTTRKSKKSELDAEKSEHDNLEEVIVPHESVFNMKDAENPELQSEKEIHYSPAVLEMQVISKDYEEGKAELVNSTQMNIFRNKGVTDKLMDEDEDRVVQKYGQEKVKKDEEPSSPSKSGSPSKTSGVIKSVQTGLSHHGGLFALIAAMLAATAVMVWKRKGSAAKKEELQDNQADGDGKTD